MNELCALTNQRDRLNAEKWGSSPALVESYDLNYDGLKTKTLLVETVSFRPFRAV